MPDSRVALLTNFIAPYRLPVFTQLARKVDDLRVLISTPMEPDRRWPVEFGDLQVELQRNWTLRGLWKHPRGFLEPVHIHLPYDTLWRLIRFRPNVVISAEMGCRTIQAILYRLLCPSSRLIVWAAVSEQSEQGRGILRRLVRSAAVRWVDAVFINGESGARYLRRLSVPDSKMFRVPYTTDLEPFLRLPLDKPADHRRRLLYVGRLSERKGVLPFLRVLAGWAQTNPARRLEFWLVGDGPLRPALERLSLPPNLRVRFLGDLAYSSLPEVYRQTEVFVFPTLADEWGLAVTEALAAGLPVLGSVYSQAIEELVRPGSNGWTFRPDLKQEVLDVLDQMLNTSPESIMMMRRAARNSVTAMTPTAVAGQIVEAIDAVASSASTVPAEPRKRRLAILTNIAAPYRLPLYQYLTKSFDITVFTAGVELNHPYWSSPADSSHLRFRWCWGLTLRRTERRADYVYNSRFLHVTPGYLWALWRWEPDTIVSTELGFRTFLALVHGFLWRRPVWVWWGGTEHTERNVGRFRRCFRRIAARMVRHWISYGEGASRYLQALGVQPRRVLQVQNCVEEAGYRAPVSPAVHLRPRPVLLYAGQFLGLKGLDRLLITAARLQSEGREFSLLLVGEGPDKERLKKLSETLGLRHVCFHDGVPPGRMPAIYRSADCFVFPTLGDVWGLVVNEALLSGIPVLCSVYAGCAEELLPEQNLFDPLNSDDFAAGLRRAVEGTLSPPAADVLMSCRDVGEIIQRKLAEAIS